MICNKDTAKKTAKLLLKIKAVKLQPNDPFTWASGWKSPIYCDNRITLSHPDVRKFIQENFTSQIKSDFPEVEVIAGVATGAIAIGVLVADALGLPFVYVRPEPKSHGRKNQIEGSLTSGQKVVVIEDLISTGMSSLNAVQALKEAEVQVLGMFAIFTYGFPEAQQAFEKAHLRLRTLSDYPTLLEEAMDTKAIRTEDWQLLDNWRKNPAQYGA